MSSSVDIRKNEIGNPYKSVSEIGLSKYDSCI